MGSVVNSVLSPRQESQLRLDFQQATVEVNTLYSYDNADWRFTPLDSGTTESAAARWNALTDNQRSSHAAQLGEVLDSMARGERPPVSGGEARRILEFIASLYKASFSGQPVRRGEITPDDPFYHAMNGAPNAQEAS
jgi:predicted dehydrogenase